MDIKSAHLDKCIKTLDCMKTPSKDNRPKTEQKLNNVLQKVAGVCNVASVLNVIFKYAKAEEIILSEVEEVKISDRELDEGIVEFASKHAAEQNRELLVLPSDSNLHTTVATNIEDWYSQRARFYDKGNPLAGIARASCIPYDLDPGEMVEALSKFQYVEIDGTGKIKLRPQPTTFLGALHKACQGFSAKIRLSLDQLSARSQEMFVRELIGANMSTQTEYADAMKKYCETQYASKYSLYSPSTQTENGIGGVIRQMEDTSIETDMGPNSGPDTMETEQANETDTLPVNDGTAIPIGLSREAAHVLLQLHKAQQKPETMSEIGEFIRNKCAVMYVISPKYILTNIIKDCTTFPKNFEFNLRLGENVTYTTLKLGNLTDLAKVLTFPGKDKTISRGAKVASPSWHQPMDTSLSDHRKDVFKSFQNHVYSMVSKKAERYRSVPIYMDPDSETRCRDRLLSWVKDKNNNPDKRVSNETFTKELIELSCELTRVPADNLIKALVDRNHIEIKGTQRTVEYNWSYSSNRRSTAAMGPEVERFLSYWEEDFKPDDSGSQILPNTCTSNADNPMSSRKRSATHYQTPAKRARVIDI